MSKRFKTMLTIVLALVMTACVASFVACGYVASCNHNYVDGVCTYCNERDPSWKYEVTITNKEDLEAQWLEASQTRELAVKITLGGGEISDLDYSVIDYVVETSDASVVSVGDDNKTLTAEGEGTATVTVVIIDAYDGSRSEDSVTVSVIPYIRGVEITNKEDLAAVWLVGDAARKLELTFKPEYYQTNKPEYTVTSSDPAVLEVGEDNLTLTAKSVGKVTVTVKAEKFSDSVEVWVRPELESVTITNKDDINAAWKDWTASRTLELAMKPAEYYTVGNTPYEVTLSDDVVSVNGLTLTAKKTGTATLTVKVGEKTDTVEVQVVRGNPTITFSQSADFTETEEGGKLGAFIGNSALLPTVYAQTCDGEYISSNVEVTLLDEGATMENGRLTADSGTYRVQYRVCDTDDESIVTEKIVTVGFYRNVYGTTDGTWIYVDGQKYVDDEDQQLTTTTNGYQLGAFNIEPSKYYYAEATFYTSEYLGGLAHYSVNNEKVNLARSLVSYVGNADTNYKLIDFDTSIGWDVQENTGKLKIIYQYRLNEYWKHAEHEDSKSGARVSKMAVARIGDYFITFWNDQYVMMYTDEFYAGQATVPGLFVNAYTGRISAVKNVVYYSGQTETEAKVKELTNNGKDVNVNYVPASWATDSQNINNRNFTSHEITEERGINFDFTKSNGAFNGTMVSNNVWFDGDFTYQWDYKNTAGSYRMMLELRNNKWYGDGGIQFGAQYDGDGVFNRFMLNATGNQEGYKWNEPGSGADASQGMRFTISRKLYEDYAEITLVATSIANPAQTYKRVVKQSADASKSSDGKTSFANWNAPLTIQWHNEGAAGEYSNINWTNSADKHPANHVYKDATYAWSEDGTECTASIGCILAGCTHALTEKATITSEVTTEKTCTLDEITTYTATFTGVMFKKQTKEVKTADKLGHDLQDVEEVLATTEHAGHSAHKACTRCDYKEGYTEYPQLESAPKLTFAETQGLTKTKDGYTLKVALAGETATLPTATAKSWQLADVSDKIAVSLLDDGATLTDGVLTAPQGEYRVQYQVSDPDNADLTTTVELTVVFSRNLIRWSDNTWSFVDGKKYVEDGEQTLINTKGGIQFLALNATASEYYYAEVEYTAANYYGGMAHFTLKDDNSLNTSRMLVSVVSNNDANYKVIDFDTTASTNAWSTQEGLDDRKVVYRYKLTKHYGYSINAKCSSETKVSKFAIARVGDNFMTFWNDQYVTTYASSYYGQGLTVPGLFLQGAPSITASDIHYVSGQEATYAKLKEITHNGKDLTTAYLGDGDDGIMQYFSGSKNTDNKNFTSNEYTEERGLNYDFTNSSTNFNGGMTSNGVWFDGDFTYQWDYIGTAGTYRSLIEIRDRRYSENESSPGIQFGVQWNNNEGTSFGFNRFLLNTAKNSSWNEPGNGQIDASKGVRFTISRKLHENYAEWIMTGQSIANPEQVCTRTIYCSNVAVNDNVVSGCSRWNEVVTVQWHNYSLAGQYSNIKWKASATEHEDHIYANPVYTWSDDLSECTVKRTCVYHDCEEVLTENVKTTRTITTKQSCTDDEVVTYTATFASSVLNTQTKQVKTENTALGHNMVTVPEKAATTEESGWNEHKACSHCGLTEGFVEYPQLESAPKITFGEASGFEATADGGKIGAFAGSVTLPTATAMSWKKADITDTMTVVVLEDGATLENGVLTAPQGTWTIEYTAKDPDNAELITAKTITVTLARNLIRWSDNTWSYVDGKKYVEDSEQTLVNTLGGHQFLAFNATPSEYYYAEVEYVYDGYCGGMAHFTYDENGLNSTRMLVSLAQDSDINYKLVDFNTQASTKAWSLKENETERNIIYQYKLNGARNMSELATSNGKKVSKMAIARIGDYFINFWNDQYIMMYASEYFAEGLTLPGLYLYGGTPTVSKISYIEGKDVTNAKVAEITHNGKDVNANYVPDTWANNSKNTNNKNFTSNEITEERGLNFDFTNANCDFNGGMVSNYVWFDGDFTYSWEYKNTAGNYRMLLELRNRMWYGDGGIQFGAQYDGDGVFNRFMLNATGNQEGYKWNEPGAGSDYSQGMRFTITRKLYEDYAEITLTATSIANPEQTYTRVIKQSSDASKSSDGKTSYSYWNYPVTVQWHNQTVAGEYSNITWKNSVN